MRADKYDQVEVPKVVRATVAAVSALHTWDWTLGCSVAIVHYFVPILACR